MAYFTLFCSTWVRKQQRNWVWLRAENFDEHLRKFSDSISVFFSLAIDRWILHCNGPYMDFNMANDKNILETVNVTREDHERGCGAVQTARSNRRIDARNGWWISSFQRCVCVRTWLVFVSFITSGCHNHHQMVVCIRLRYNLIDVNLSVWTSTKIVHSHRFFKFLWQGTEQDI